MTLPFKDRRFLPLVLLLCPALLILLERLHTYAEPLERDITTYAVIGKELLKGRLLYTDLWDHKFPAIHATFALAEAVAGMGPLSVFLLNILAAFATLAGLFKAGKAIGGLAGGLWAAWIWAVVSGDLYLQANQPNTEVFISAFQTWVFALWLQSRADHLEPRRWVMLGILLSLASFYKPFAPVEGVMLTLAYVFLNRSKPDLRKRACQQAAICFLCVLGLWTALIAYFSLQGRWDDFKTAVFTYNAYYDGFFRHFLSGSWSEIFRNFPVYDMNSRNLIWLPLLSLPAILAALFDWNQKGRRGPWLFCLAFLLAAYVEVFSMGRFNPHYYQLLLPPTVLGGAWAAVVAGERTRPRWKRLHWVPGGLIVAALAFYEAPFYRLSPEGWTEKKYDEGALFVQTYPLGREIQGLLKPGETFFEWGNESQLYFVSQCSPPAGLFYIYPLSGTPLARSFSQRILRDLEKSQPELMVLNTLCLNPGRPINNAILQWVRSHYRLFPVHPQQGYFLFLLRKGGKLEKRLSAPSVPPPPGRGNAS
jgi:4-amino-4-deoxy-L-arabinose transferase-like glycosyltransferase